MATSIQPASQITTLDDALEQIRLRDERAPRVNELLGIERAIKIAMMLQERAPFMTPQEIADLMRVAKWMNTHYDAGIPGIV